jgi:Uma2 family endonuclease
MKTKRITALSCSGDRDMATPAYKLRYTYDDYLLFPEDGMRHEIIGGEHYVTAAPSRKHQIAVGNLHRILATFIYERRLGRLYPGPLAVVLSNEDVVEPDLLFISQERSAIEQDRGAFGAPDLVIEVLSPFTRRTDENLKRRLYEASGVREYWIVDPLQETVEVHLPAESGEYRVAAELSAGAGDVLATPLLPGLAVPLERIFE